MAENKLVKILKETAGRNKLIENRLVDILKESMARDPSAGAPPVAQNLLKNKTVDELVRILKNLTQKQKNAVAQTATPPVAAAAAAVGGDLPENKTPDELVRILKETLNSNIPKNTKTEVSSGIVSRFGEWLKTTRGAAGPVLSTAAVSARAKAAYGAGRVVDGVKAVLDLLKNAGLSAKDQLAVLRKVPAIHREWMV
jgi:hypothetical protein